jgi:hypothetical protein
MAGITWRLRPRGIAADGVGCEVPADPKPSTPLNPALEFAMAFNGPQYWTAEFPGIALTGAYNVVRSPMWGAAILAEGDASYVRASKSAGARVFVRTPATASGRFGASVFAQYLVGTVDAGRSGIIVSTGGHLTQPGIGFTVGKGRYSFVWQMDRQHVPGSIHDEMRGDTAPLSRTRTSIGFVRRFLDR